MDDAKEFIAVRVAKELHHGDFVNLGIGLPTMVVNYLPQGIEVTLQAENGIVGVGPKPSSENAQPEYVVDAGGQPSSILVGGAFIDSMVSFGIIRGGHLDICVLGALEVDQEGNLSNWIIPGKKVPGMGGAMDLAIGAKKVIVAMEHTNKGRHKILKKCKLPFTAINCVDMIITEMGVMTITEKGIELNEYNSEFTVGQIQEATECELIISPNLKRMM